MCRAIIGIASGISSFTVNRRPSGKDLYEYTMRSESYGKMRRWLRYMASVLRYEMEWIDGQAGSTFA
jgi:hypothetical protein